MEQEAILNTNNVAEEMVDICETPAKTGISKIAKVGLIAAGLTGLTAATYGVVKWFKKRKASKNQSSAEVMAEELKAQGYTVVPPLDDCSDEIIVSED